MDAHPPNPPHIHVDKDSPPRPYANLLMGKEEHIILAFLYLIYFSKRFIDDIFLSSSVLTPSSNLDDIYEHNQPYH